jgi:hypothetical protein
LRGHAYRGEVSGKSKAGALLLGYKRVPGPPLRKFSKALEKQKVREKWPRNMDDPALCPSILVLEQLITDELNLRAVEPEMLYEFVSVVLCTPHAQLVGLTVDALQPLIHLEHLAEHDLGECLQPVQLGMSHAQQTPI